MGRHVVRDYTGPTPTEHHHAGGGHYHHRLGIDIRWIYSRRYGPEQSSRHYIAEVMYVNDDGPAKVAGVKKGWRPESINGTDVRTREQYCSALSTAGHQFEMTFAAPNVQKMRECLTDTVRVLST